MSEQDYTPKTLMDAIEYFSDPKVCHDFVVAMRWPNGVYCPVCGSCDIGEIKSRQMFQCKQKECRKQFSVKKNTIFEDSALPLNKWLVAIWMDSNCKNGVSSCEISRELGITQKCAWHMLHRIRWAMHDEGNDKLSGVVQIDETYIGPCAANLHKGKRKVTGTGAVGKVAVMGLLERNGRIRTIILEHARQKIMDATVRANVAKGSEIHTDGHAGYVRLVDEYIHKFVDHAECYVRDNVHTNGLENFWSLLKRGIRGTYVSVEPFHLFRYLDEQAFRFNTRKLKNAERFVLVMSMIAGKKLTYATLTAEPVTPQ